MGDLFVKIAHFEKQNLQNARRTVKKLENKTEVAKTMLAFDIDHTLCLSKQPIPKEVAELLVQLLKKFEICIISGRSFSQFLDQVVSRLPITDMQMLKHLHLLPAQGTQYYHYAEGWEQVYAYFLKDEDVSRIFTVVRQAAKELGYWRKENHENGDKVLENRESQVTFAAVDTGAPAEVKQAWDPDHVKRETMIARMRELAPEFEYKLGGSTSIDITTVGMDKGYGMRRLVEELDISLDEILYFGDMTQPGGNDYPIVQMGIKTITVQEYTDTVFAMKAILGVLE